MNNYIRTTYMAVTTGRVRQLAKVNNFWPGDTKSYLRQPVIAPQSTIKIKEPTDSCFALIGAHQCGILEVYAGRLAAFISTPNTLVE